MTDHSDINTDMTETHPTIVYSLAQSPFQIHNIDILKSNPPSARIVFSTMAYWDTQNHEIDAISITEYDRIKIEVTLKIPPIGPMKGTPIIFFVDLPPLAPGRYPVDFYFQRVMKNPADDHCTPMQLVDTLVLVAEGSEDQKSLLESDIKVSKSYAWLDFQPNRPPKLHVTCEVAVNDPHTIVNLEKAVPQGFNPDILLLYLVSGSRKEPGPLVQEAHYFELYNEQYYSSIQIVCPNSESVSIDFIDHIF